MNELDKEEQDIEKSSTKHVYNMDSNSDKNIFNEFFQNLKQNEQSQIEENDEEEELLERKHKLAIITRLFCVKKRGNKELIMEYCNIFYKYKIPCVFLKSEGEWHVTYLNAVTFKPEIELLRRDRHLFERIFTNVHTLRQSNLVWDSKPISELLDFDGRSKVATRDRSMHDFKCFLKSLKDKNYFSNHEEYVNDVMSYLTELDSCSIM